MSATPFAKILVANRGEIALRVLRTARAMGFRTVAVYSRADADARHVREADQSVCIGESLPAQSYLRIPALIEAARLSGADAVHPGYGFLAENADFAQACRDAGLVFIGPAPESIRAMGDKAGAKALMQAAGVPCIPGYQGDDQDEARLVEEAARIGYPVMIKATAGGGGRGMRLVPSAADFAPMLHSARSEAVGAFGDPRLILERAVVDARHIEIQVFGDRHGHAVHLGERDCSVQRRHQKLIEEAPSPRVDATLRGRMGAAAVAAVKAIGYEGAGTLEFLLDDAGDFFFMEMNTRLQVEHPVTEALTGLDLVEWQLRVAAGEPLPLAQEQIRWQGHAMEVRLCAEDAAQGFMPQSGRMAVWRKAALLRAEDALEPGAEIAPFYDSMVAKLIAHGRDREEARRRLVAGLEDTVALGVTTNQAFLRNCLLHPVFAAGGATTGFVAAHSETLLAPDPDTQSRAAVLAAVLLYETSGDRAHPARRQGMRHTLPIGMRFELDGRGLEATLQPRSARACRVSLGERQWEIEWPELDGRAIRFVCDGLGEHAAWQRDGARLNMHYRGAAFSILDTTRAATVQAGAAQGDGKLRASMNGRVVSVLVAQGDAVQAGQPILALEAMKMEHVHAAPVSGRVLALHVQPGDQVATSWVLAEIEIELAPGAAGEASA
jgi:geranyl-CoA carboxylase alpha subunit